MSFEYKDEIYGSKAEVIRKMYDSGEVNMDADSKKKAADTLGMTVQTVHATLKKYQEQKGEIPKSEIKSKKKIISIPSTESSNEYNNETGRDNNDDGDGCTRKTRPKKGQIFITTAPNKWGLPVTNPPMEIRTNEYVE